MTIDCEHLKWSYAGWACRLKERRKDHHIEVCPKAYGENKCYDTGEKVRRIYANKRIDGQRQEITENR